MKISKEQYNNLPLHLQDCFIENKNTHCTKKSISLFSYLITLFSSKENDIILDPFCGSGATCIASVLTNRKYIGIDMSKEYCDITEARVKYWQDLKNAKVDSEPEVDKQLDLF